MTTSESRAETVLALMAVGLSGLFLFEGAKLKPGVFEPIGPGAVPMGVAIITIALSLAVLVGQMRRRARRSKASPASAQTPPAPVQENWRQLLIVGGASSLYVALLQAGVVRYGFVTVAFLLLTFLSLARDVRRASPWAVALALGFGMGLDYVFRYLLVADLP